MVRAERASAAVMQKNIPLTLTNKVATLLL
jgi:hypothetical protein